MYTPTPELSHLVEHVKDPLDTPHGMLTSRAETDGRSALTRGLAEYLRQLAIEGPGGRRIWFRGGAFYDWDVRKETAHFPAAHVHAPEAGTYDYTALGDGSLHKEDELDTSVDEDKDWLPKNRRLYGMRMAELSCPLVIEVWGTDLEERIWISRMLETWVIAPVDWMNGFRLNLPHYHGCRGEYCFEMAEVPDEAEAVRARKWKLVLRGKGWLGLIRVIDKTPLQPAGLQITLDGRVYPGA